MSAGEQPPSDDPSREVSPDVLVATYEALAELAARMHECAVAGNWSELLALESEYIQSVTELSGMRPSMDLSPVQRQRRVELLELILDHNVQVKGYLERRRAELGEMINRTRRQDQVDAAYGPRSGLQGPAASTPSCDAH